MPNILKINKLNRGFSPLTLLFEMKYYSVILVFNK